MGTSQDNLLVRSLNLLNANLIFVAGAALLEIHILNWGGFFVVLQSILKIIFYAGMYGMVLEFVSKESMVISRERFKTNVHHHWKSYVLISLIPIVIHYLLFSFFPYSPVSLTVVQLSFNVLISALIVIVFLSQKYFRVLSLSRRRVNVSSRECLVLVLLWILLMASCILPSLMNVFVARFILIPLFIRLYISLLIFIFIAQIVVEAYPEIRQRFTYDTELYLINPIEGGGVFYHWSTFLLIRTYPAWITILRALTPERYHVRVFNRVIWHDRYFASGKLVGISCPTTNNSPEAYKLAKEFKKRGSTVIMGGLHVQTFPEEALEYCDSVVMGEAEGVWPQIIKDYENKCLREKYDPVEDEEARQRIHAFQLTESPSVIRESIETTRGCKYNCYFCALQNMRLSRRRIAIDQVIELVQRFREKHRWFVFLDSNLYSDPVYLKELFHKLKPLNVRWLAAGTPDMGEDESLLVLAKEAGCRFLYIGYEVVPGSQELAQGGKLRLANQYVELTRKIQKKGIFIRAHYIVGFDTQGPKVLWDLFKFNFFLNPFIMAVFILTPLPGSPFFRDILPQNRITTLNWRNYNLGTLVFKPKRMPAFLLQQPFFFVYTFVMFVFTNKLGWLVGIAFLFNFMGFFSH